MIALAVATGISMDVWVRWGSRAIVTAYDLIEEAKESREAGGDG